MSKLLQLKKEYNKLLMRNDNGEKFLQSGAFLLGSKEQQEHWIKGFQDITIGLSRLRYEIREEGYEMNTKEILYGFKEV